MKLSLSWIRDYVSIPETIDLKKLAYDLTMSTVEVENVEDLSRRFDKMIVGMIREVKPHPNADRLKVCKTDIGGGDVKEIVCGGSNLCAGMRVAVSCPGAVSAGTEKASLWYQKFQTPRRGVLRHDLRFGAVRDRCKRRL